VNRAFGEALKTAGIGADIIPRDSRDCYEFVGANADAVRQFVTTDSKMIKKAQSIKLSPYIIKATMTGAQKESAGDTLEKLVANIVTRADALNVTKARIDRRIAEGRILCLMCRIFLHIPCPASAGFFMIFFCS
jgi:hypothetical protein